jgi:hypothetical protein
MNDNPKKALSSAALLGMIAFGTWHYLAPAPVPTRRAAPEPDETICSDAAGIDTIFTLMSEKGTMDPKKPLTWGFFFLDTRRAPLESLAGELAGRGYRVVGLTEPGADADDVMLHVEKVEVPSAETLRSRNEELCELARRFQSQSYDGWDVGHSPDDLPPQLREALTGPD